MSATSAQRSTAMGPAVPITYASPAYRQAYGRINGMVVVGEGLADRHFRRLAGLLPHDRAELLRLGAMEARHARDFVGCGRNLGVKADAALAHRLLAPLHQQFQEAEASGDLVSCLVIQCLIIECFAVAAYRLYLPVADPYAAPITAAVIADEREHLNYGEQWLRPWACWRSCAATWPRSASTTQSWWPSSWCCSRGRCRPSATGKGRPACW